MNQSKSQAHAIGTSRRTDIVDKNQTELPGPGNYSGNDEFGKNAKGFAFSGRRDDKYNDVPGPGSYS